jgi:hypothetical protein
MLSLMLELPLIKPKKITGQLLATLTPIQAKKVQSAPSQSFYGNEFLKP